MRVAGLTCLSPRPTSDDAIRPAPKDVLQSATPPRRFGRMRVAVCSALAAGAIRPVRATGVVDDQFVVRGQVQSICRIVASAARWPLGTLESASSPATLNAWAQVHLKKPPRTERMEPVAKAHYSALYALLTRPQIDEVFELFEAIGDVGAQSPPHKHYDYILIHGSTVQAMRARIASVARAVARKQLVVTPKTQIVFLDGERALFDTELAEALKDPYPYQKRQGWQAPEQLPSDERGAAELVWDQLLLPDALRHTTPLFVHAPKASGARRAETKDTVALWAAQKPMACGRALMVSDNPFIEYQRLVTHALMRRHGLEHVRLEAMGPDVRLTQEPEYVRLGILLDNLAACLHWACRLREEGTPLHGWTAD